MSKADIELVRAAELAADSTRKRADDDAASAITEGKKKAKELIDLSHKEAEELYKSAIAIAEAEATKIYEEIIEKERKQCDSVKESGRTKLDEAADMIVGKVVGINGNS